MATATSLLLRNRARLRMKRSACGDLARGVRDGFARDGLFPVCKAPYCLPRLPRGKRNLFEVNNR
jgi:hypothetical protein